SWSGSPQDQAGNRNGSRAAGDEGKFGIFHLIHRRAAHLLDTFAYVRHADDVSLGQLAAVGVDRNRAGAMTDGATFDKGAAFAAFAEAVLFQLHQHHRREVVVQERNVDVVGGQAGVLPQTFGDRRVAGGGEVFIRH